MLSACIAPCLPLAAAQVTTDNNGIQILHLCHFPMEKNKGFVKTEKGKESADENMGT